jgi:hydrogenase maturation factor
VLEITEQVKQFVKNSFITNHENERMRKMSIYNVLRDLKMHTLTQGIGIGYWVMWDKWWIIVGNIDPEVSQSSITKYPEMRDDIKGYVMGNTWAGET